MLLTHGVPDRPEMLPDRRSLGVAHPCEIIVVDTGPPDRTDRAAWAEVERRGGIRVEAPGAWASRARNTGASAASGDYLWFIDGGLVPEDGSWPTVIEELVGRMAGPNAGAASPWIIGPDGLVRSAGLVLGPGLTAAPALADRSVGEPGYTGLLEVAHEVSAVSADALMTRRDGFERLGGFDEVRLASAFADVDYCLRLRAEGQRIIVTPDARMLARPSAAARSMPRHEARLAREAALLQARWGEVLMADPFYHPALALDGSPYSALAWPPRERLARTNRIGRPRAVPSGF